MRPSAWHAGLGFGMTVCGAMLVPMAVGELPFSWTPFVAGLACVGIVPLGEYLIIRLWIVFTTLHETQQAWLAQAEPAPTIELDPAMDDMHWRIAADRFVRAGEAWGFGIRTLANKDDAPETYIISRSDWSCMVEVLCEAGVLATGPRGTAWEAGRSLAWWRLNWQRVALPHRGQSAPSVQFPVNAEHRDTPKQAENTA